MDKADILELAVQHMQQMNIEQQQKQRLLQQQHHTHHNLHQLQQEQQQCVDHSPLTTPMSELPLSPHSLSSSPTTVSQCSSRSTSPDIDATFRPLSRDHSDHSDNDSDLLPVARTIYRPVAYLATSTVTGSVQYFVDSDDMNNSMWRPW